jgi:phenylacetate-CoA ligase
VKVPSIRAVILTYGKASRSTAGASPRSFPAPQVDLYGSTEAGYLFVGEAFGTTPGRSTRTRSSSSCRGARARPASTRSTSRPGAARRCRSCATTPATSSSDARTASGSSGRERDLHFRPDGSLVSADDVDAALPADFSCWHYCLDARRARAAGTSTMWPTAADGRGVEAALAGLLGPGVRVNAFRRKSIAPAASGKFSLLKPLAGSLQPLR